MSKNICRICLTAPKPKKQPVLVQDKHKDQTYAALFKNISGFCIEDDEPQILCHDCRLELVQCFKFIQKCKQAQEHLKGVNLQPEMVKVEDDVLNEKVTAACIVKIEEDVFNSEPMKVDDFKPEDSELYDHNSDFNDDDHDFDDFEPEEEKPSKNSTTTSTTQERLQCDLCTNNSYLYASMKSLTSHKCSAHKINVCPFCQRIKNLATLEHHKSICKSNPANTGKFEDSEPEESNPSTNDLDAQTQDKQKPNQIVVKKFRRKSGYTHKAVLCDLCIEQGIDNPKMYYFSRTLTAHKIQVHKINHCPFCNIEFKDLKSHKTHCILNPENKDDIDFDKCFTCKHCTESKAVFQTRNYFQIHLKKQHGLEPSVNCQYCLKFFFPEVINDHMLYCQKNPDKILRPVDNNRNTLVPCPQCGKTVKKKRLSTHINKIHTNKWKKSQNANTRMFCDFCPGKSFTKPQLISHMKVNHLDYKELCSLCGAVFSLKLYLEKHQRLVHTDLFPLLQCSQCPFKTADTNSLAVHESSHRSAAYSCNVCGKGYQTEQQLTSHLRCHSEERQFPCDICGKRFTTLKKSREHKRIVHLNASSYECPVCNKRFSMRSNATHHIRKYHPETQLQTRMVLKESRMHPDAIF